VDEIVFNVSSEPTIGVELELQLLDPENLMFKDAAPGILSEIGPSYKERIKEEFIQSMIELNTRPCLTVADVDEDLRENLAYLQGILDRLETVFYSASLHPLEKGTGENLTQKPRYVRIMDDLKMVGWRFITQGIHVHIGVDSARRAVKINNTIRMYLPLLLALATSSPYYCGEDTGLLSYRTKLFEALPLAGMPDSLEDWEEFTRMASLLLSGGIIESVKDLWWDVRPHPGFGTVEVRIADIPCRYEEILALTALIQSLVVTLGHVNVHPEARTQMQILKSNKWQAARYGLEGVFVNPIAGTRTPMKNAVRDLLKLVEPEARNLGGYEYFEIIEKILHRGTGAHRQRSLYGASGDFHEMIDRMRGEFFS
jgi:carboxylate-amine ligase